MTVSLRAIVFGRRSDGILLVRFTCLICSQMVVGQKKHTQNVPIPPFANCVTAEPALKKKIQKSQSTTARVRYSSNVYRFHWAKLTFIVCVSIEKLQIILRQSYLSRRLLVLKPRFLFFLNKKKTRRNRIETCFFSLKVIQFGLDMNTTLISLVDGAGGNCGAVCSLFYWFHIEQSIIRQKKETNFLMSFSPQGSFLYGIVK